MWGYSCKVILFILKALQGPCTCTLHMLNHVQNSEWSGLSVLDWQHNWSRWKLGSQFLNSNFSLLQQKGGGRNIDVPVCLTDTVMSGRSFYGIFCERSLLLDKKYRRTAKKAPENLQKFFSFTVSWACRYFDRLENMSAPGNMYQVLKSSLVYTVGPPRWGFNGQL